MGIFRKVVERAIKDPEFRAALEKDPKSAIAKEFAIEFPKNVVIHLHENSEHVMHLVLPSPLKMQEQPPLDAEALSRMAGLRARPREEVTYPCTNTWCARIA